MRSAMRLALLALFCLIGTGCIGIGRQPWPPAADIPAAVTVYLFNDGFHSGIVMPSWALPLEVADRYADGSARKRPWVEIGYGEEQWLTARDQGLLHSARLFVWPDDGMLLIRYLDTPFPPRIRDHQSRSWPLQVSADGWARFSDLLATWVDTESHVLVPRDLPGCYYLYSRNAYWIGRTCHDFTAACLRSFGLPLAGWPVRWNAAIQSQIDDVQEVRARHGLGVLDPSLFDLPAP